MSKKKVISSNDAPQAIGPYSQGLVVSNAVYLSGQLGIDPATGRLKGDVRAQAGQALANIKAILEQAGCTMQDVVQVQVFLQDMGDFGVFNEVYREFFVVPYPARAVVGAAALPAAAKIEILVVAYKGPA